MLCFTNIYFLDTELINNSLLPKLDIVSSWPCSLGLSNMQAHRKEDTCGNSPLFSTSCRDSSRF